DFLARGEGLSMVLLKSDNAREDARQFREAEIGAFDVFDFERQGTGPDGTSVKLAFSLAFARDPVSQHAGFATCQHHFPQSFWNPAHQIHENGTRGIGATILVADNPADHHIFLSAFTGVRLLHSNSIGVTAHTPHGELAIMQVPSFRDQFGVTPKLDGEGTSFAGLRILAADLMKLDDHLRTNNIACYRHVGRIIIPPEAAFGATLIFEQIA
ncbi:MAG TPA: hypothetical protein VGO84_17055, partial [Burkholderiales bacterium]|nr:hypothetical protein [Burkholderiales bacterium]